MVGSGSGIGDLVSDWYERTIGYYPRPLYQGSAPEDPIPEYGSLRNFSTGSKGPTFNEITSRIYPMLWFEQMQTYVRALLDNKPTDTEERVYWSLMLMGAIGQGMFAFNANDLTWDCFLNGMPYGPDQLDLIGDQNNPEGRWNRRGPVRQAPFSGTNNAPQLEQLLTTPELKQRSHALPMLGRIWPESRRSTGRGFSYAPTYGRRESGWQTFSGRDALRYGPDNLFQQPWLLSPSQAQTWMKRQTVSRGSGTYATGMHYTLSDHLTQLAAADAPFLRLPLISFQNRDNTYTFGGFRPGGVGEVETGFRADWWNNWIAAPCSAHVPWSTHGGRLFFETPARIGRWYNYKEKGWKGSRLYEDSRAKLWLSQERAALDDPWGKRGMLLAMWNFFAFTGRYDNVFPVCQERGIPCDVEGRYQDPVNVPLKKDGNYGNNFFATLPDLVWAAKIAWGETPNPYPLVKTQTYTNAGSRVVAKADFSKVFSHKTAWESGTYDAWGEWFASLDLPGNLDGLHNAFYVYNAQGAISGKGIYTLGAFSEATGINTTAKPAVWASVFMTPEGVEEIKDQESWMLVGEFVSYLTEAVQLVANLWTGNVYQAFKALNNIKNMTWAAAERAGVYPWDTVKESPQGFLRTLNPIKGNAGWCAYDQTNGTEADNQKQRFSTQSDVMQIILQAKSAIGAYSKMYLKEYQNSPAFSASRMFLVGSQLAKVQVTPPSAGGPKASAPKPKVTAVGSEKTKEQWRKAGIFGSAAAFGAAAVLAFKRKGKR